MESGYFSTPGAKRLKKEILEEKVYWGVWCPCLSSIFMFALYFLDFAGKRDVIQ